MKSWIKKTSAFLMLGFFGITQAFADVSIDGLDSSTNQGMSLGWKIFLGIVILSIFIGVGKGIAKYVLAPEQEKSKILSTTLSTMIIAFVILMALFGLGALFINQLGLGSLVSVGKGDVIFL